ncbi:LysR family transcriptional regulator [Photobacterium sanguinicancri]|uniref:LysR family transcriptional regulator n=1 Tax=Photobacterium sanguinicancri TaxID=875932 RepID=UPI003D0BB1D3
MKGSLFNQIETFLTIAQEGSIRGAARKLELSPPAVSNALKQLESYLGLPLFTRTTRTIEFTEAGKCLMEQTSPAMNALHQALESVQDLSQIPSGKVRITVPRFAYQLIVEPIYAEFCSLYPEVELEISVSNTSINIIKEGYDAGIRFGHRIEEGMVARPLMPKMKEALFATPDYLERFGSPSTPQDLQHHKLIQYRYMPSNQLAPLELNDKGETIRLDPPLSMIVNDTDLMIDAASKGLGIGRIVGPMIQEGLSSGQFIPILEEYWIEYPGLYIYFPQHSQKARRVRVLVDFICQKSTTLL